jgi:hypothetical protein
MTMTRTLLTFAVSLWLAAPVLAQDAAPAPTDAPALDTAATPPPDAAPSPEAAPTEAAPVAQPAPEPAAAPVTPPPADDAAPKDKDADDEVKCVAGKLCFGPVLTLGLLNPFGIGVHARYDRDWGFGLDFQFLSLPAIGGVTAGMSLLSLDGRWYPGGSNFFLAGGFAYQSISMEAVSGGLTSKGSIGVPLFTLGFGLMGGEGFVMGIDLALEIPLGSADVSLESKAPNTTDPDMLDKFDSLNKDVKDFGENVVKLLPVLFQLNLIRIGYMF